MTLTNQTLTTPPNINTLPLRPPDVVMQLKRLGAFHQTRLSFARSMVRKMIREHWRITTALFDLDRQGYGTCIYRIEAPGELYHVVIFADPLADDERTDRVIAEKWDIACALCEGEVSEARLASLRAVVPKQEAGRNQTDVLVISRANKSVRNFDYFVDCLSRGEQPDPEVLTKVGYLHRTTAVYGNGKFGVADYDKVRRRSAFDATFSAQMFTVFMIRHFSLTQVEHIARHNAPTTAVSLNDKIKRFMGIGNATGLGMAPFLVRHPKLIHAWLYTREVAIARVVNAQTILPQHVEKLRVLIDKALTHFRQSYTDDARQQQNYALICDEMPLFKAELNRLTESSTVDSLPANLWADLVSWAFHTASLETQELINSLLLELYPDLVDTLEVYTGAEERYALRPDMSVSALKELIEHRYQWALQIDFEAAGAQHYFWYRSLEKEEPRLGERDHEPGAGKEMEIAISRSVQQLYEHIQSLPVDDLSQSIVHFLLKYPVYKGIVRRIQSLQQAPYAEIRSNLIDQSCLPIHLLRCKLACFGASKFDPKSDRWIRITLFQGAPLVSDFEHPFTDDWCFPVKPTV